MMQGLASGIDYQSIITSMVDADSVPMDDLQTEMSNDQNTVSLMQTLNSDLSSLQSAAGTLADSSSLNAKTATPADASLLSATADSTAAAGTYDIGISQVAQSNTIMSEGFSGTGSSIATSSGSLKLKVGSSTVDIPVTAGMTLSDLSGQINAADGDIQSSIINDGSATNPYRLVLTGTQSGSANAIQVQENDTSIASFNSLGTGFVEPAEASSGNSFDGTATSSGTYTGASSTDYTVRITTGGAIGTAQFQVSADDGQTWGAAQTTSTNATAIGDGVNMSFALGTQDFAAGDTFTVNAFNPTVSKAQDAVFSVNGINYERNSNSVSDAITGVDLQLLSPTNTGSTTSLTVSEDTNAVASDVQQFVSAYNSVINFFTTNASYDASTQTAGPLFGDFTVQDIQNSLSNYISQQVSGLTGGYTSLSSIGITSNSDGTLTLDSGALSTALSNDPDDVMSLLAGNSQAGVTGIASEFNSYLTDVTDPNNGIMATRINDLNNTITQENNEIQDDQTQINAYTQSLQARFSNLESIISSYNTTSNFIQDQVNELQGNNNNG